MCCNLYSMFYVNEFVLKMVIPDGSSCLDDINNGTEEPGPQDKGWSSG